MSIEVTETPVETPEQPLPWLIEYQRAQCNGGSPLTTFQGLFADEIVLPQSAVDHHDPAQLVLAMDAWVEGLLSQAYFLPGEFAQEALWSYYARDYFTQVIAGSHAQYYANRGGDEIAIRSAQSGLKSMLADPHLELFNLLVRLKRLKPSAARKLAKQNGYRSPAAAIRDLDKRFAELEAKEPLTPRHKTWLKSLRKVKFAPDSEMTNHLQRVANTNKLIARRKMEAERVAAERLRSEPSFKAVKTLCDMADVKISRLRTAGFMPMRAVWPDGPDANAYVFRADTDKGVRLALFYAEGRFFKRYLSALILDGGGLPVGSQALSKAEYEAIVPKGA
jgi:hypothetical protein